MGFPRRSSALRVPATFITVVVVVREKRSSRGCSRARADARSRRTAVNLPRAISEFTFSAGIHVSHGRWCTYTTGADYLPSILLRYGGEIRGADRRYFSYRARRCPLDIFHFRSNDWMWEPLMTFLGSVDYANRYYARICLMRCVSRPMKNVGYRGYREGETQDDGNSTNDDKCL